MLSFFANNSLNIYFWSENKILSDQTFKYANLALIEDFSDVPTQPPIKLYLIFYSISFKHNYDKFCFIMNRKFQFCCLLKMGKSHR